MTPLRRAVLACLLVPLLVLVSCGNGGPMQPAAWGPTWGGQVYCGYVVSPLECVGEPGIPMQMPLVAPVGYYNGMNSPTSLLTALFLWHLTYHAWYGSPRYYQHYVPVQYRTVYVTRYVRPFDSRYRSAERSAQSRSVYRNSRSTTRPSSRTTPRRGSTPKPYRPPTVRKR